MADWYVDIAGNDTTGDGSSGNPYLTLGKAISVASAGDNFYLSAGRFRERNLCLLNNVSIVGTLDVNGNPATVLDGSDSGAATWTQPGGSYHANTWSTSTLARAYRAFVMISDELIEIPVIEPTTQPWQDIMQDEDYIDPNSGVSVLGNTGMLLCYDDVSGDTFFRAKDGSDPNAMELYIAGNSLSALEFRSSGGLLKDLMFEGAEYGLLVKDCDGATIRHCRGSHGEYRILGVRADNVTVDDCYFFSRNPDEMKYGEWSAGVPYQEEKHLCRVLWKSYVGINSSKNNGVRFSDCDGPTLKNCAFDQLAIAIPPHDSSQNITIKDCTICRCVSVGITLNYGQTGTVEDCTFVDCNSPCRPHELEIDSARDWTVSRCTFRSLGTSGRAIFCHWTEGDPDPPDPIASDPIVRFVDCVFRTQGGGIEIGLASKASALGWLPGFSFEGCLFDVVKLTSLAAFRDAAGAVGRFVNNTIISDDPDADLPVWVDNSNQVIRTNEATRWISCCGSDDPIEQLASQVPGGNPPDPPDPPEPSSFISFPVGDPLMAALTGLSLHPDAVSLMDETNGSNLHPDFGEGLYQGSIIGIPINWVDHDQALSPMYLNLAEGWEDDHFDWTGAGHVVGSYSMIPIPAVLEVEEGAGDDHALIVQRDAAGVPRYLFETWRTDQNGPGGNWQAQNLSVFDLQSDVWQRGIGKTSADAAGLPIAPLLWRWDEVQDAITRGDFIIPHPMRFTVPLAGGGQMLPATHWAGGGGTSYPPEGTRYRLKASEKETYSDDLERVVRYTLAEYGLIIADNGGGGTGVMTQGEPNDNWDNTRLATIFNALNLPDHFEIIEAPGGAPNGPQWDGVHWYGYSGYTQMAADTGIPQTAD